MYSASIDLHATCPLYQCLSLEDLYRYFLVVFCVVWSFPFWAWWILRSVTVTHVRKAADPGVALCVLSDQYREMWNTEREAHSQISL